MVELVLVASSFSKISFADHFMQAVKAKYGVEYCLHQDTFKPQYWFLTLQEKPSPEVYGYIIEGLTVYVRIKE